jgi:hypothetical protein
MTSQQIQEHQPGERLLTPGDRHAGGLSGWAAGLLASRVL